MTGRTRVVLVSGAVAAAGMLVLMAARLDPLEPGLSATAFTTTDWQMPVHAAVGVPSTPAINHLWAGAVPPAFSIEWTGALLTLRDGTYTLATTSDDGSWVYVDGQAVVDNGGSHGATTASGTVRLSRGVHTIRVKYFQDGGPFDFDLLAGSPAAPLAPLPDWMLAPRRVSFPRFVASVVLRRSAPVLLLVAVIASALAAVAFVWPWLAIVGSAISPDRLRLALAGVLTGSFLLNVWGIWWGLPGYSWAGDELTPPAVYNAFERGFSRGWFDRWPPLQFYVLSAVYAPFLLLERIGWLAMSGAARYTALVFISRVVSLVLASATVAIVYSCGARVFSRRAGVFAALALALLVPFVYYAKTANVDMPLTFWIAVSLFFLIRVLQRLAFRDYLLFAVTATLAVCTKDQAYAVYLAAPFLIVHAQWRRNKREHCSRPLVRAVFDRRLVSAAAAAIAVFAACHNLLFNAAGFVQHVRYITGAGSEGYRLFDASLAGRARLLAETVRLDTTSWGWPLSLMSIVGFIVAVRDERGRAIAWSLAAIAVSYYVGFINVILYNYDRFLLPICLIQALFAGVACDRLILPGVMRRVGIFAVAAVFGYSLLYASTVDLVMARDSRYTVERWMHAHVGAGDTVAMMFAPQYLPRLTGRPWLEVRSVEDLREAGPTFYVLNADYARALAPGSEPAQLVAGLQHERLGYRLAFAYRAPAPWPWLPGAHPDLVGPRRDLPVFTFLRNINPTIEVYQRTRVRNP